MAIFEHEIPNEAKANMNTLLNNQLDLASQPLAERLVSFSPWLIAGTQIVAENETVFRVTAASLVIFGLVVRLYYQRKLKNIKRDVPRGGQRDRIYYFLVMGGFILTLVYSVSTGLDFAHLALPVMVRWLGAVLAMASVALFVACHQALGRNWSGVVQLSENHSLVTHGPYRYIRHPMYTSFFSTALGLALVTANWVVAAACIGSVGLMYLARVADEERMMLQAFGSAYEAYTRKTGRLLPKLW